MKMIISQRNYREYNLDNILQMTPDEFDLILRDELYSLVLIYRLLELRANFLDMEEYDYLVPIRNWADENRVDMSNDDDDEY